MGNWPLWRLGEFRDRNEKFVHTMCRLGGADSTWMVEKGSVTQDLATAAMEAGAVIETVANVDGILVERAG
jgi:phytoene dehydrogenase-like protein